MRITVPGAGVVGLVTDPYEQDVPPQGWSNVQNARFGPKGARAVKGHTQVLIEDSVATPITPLWVKYFINRLDPIWAIANNNAVYAYQDFEYTDITRASGAYAAVDRWQGSLFNTIGILNNGEDAPQMWAPIDSSQVLVDLSNWPSGYKVRFIKPFKEFLITGHVNDGSDIWPFRILWSHRAAPGTVPTSWDASDPAVDAGFRDLSGNGALVDGLEMGQQFILYRENSTWGMSLSNNDQIMNTYRLSDSSGIMWKDCVLEIPQKGHVVATLDDLIIHQGNQGSFQSVLEARVRREIASAVNRENYRNCFLTMNEPEKEIWFCFPEEGFTYANRALLWNWATGQVGHRDLESVPFADAGPILLEE